VVERVGGLIARGTAAALLASSAQAQRPIPSAAVRSGTLSFDGQATAGDFTGTTSTLSGEISGGASLAEVRGWVEAPVASLVTGNDRRDRDLNKSMESARFPTIRFELTSVRAEWERGDSAEAVLGGNLTIHGVTLPRELGSTLVFQGDSVRVQATFPLNLKDHKIGGLSKFLGVLKMYPDIVVHVDIVFGPTAPEPPGTDRPAGGR
jgi:polyisoprenoid-binding protein YceI